MDVLRHGSGAGCLWYEEKREGALLRELEAKSLFSPRRPLARFHQLTVTAYTAGLLSIDSDSAPYRPAPVSSAPADYQLDGSRLNTTRSSASCFVRVDSCCVQRPCELHMD